MTGHRWLAACALAYGLLHHQGTALSRLGDASDGTRWADWLDLGTPYAVLLPVAGTLMALAADRVSWGCYLLGAVTYVEGHGLHLAANSIGNVDPSPTAHLWDEQVGHHFWIAGVVLVTAALLRAAQDLPMTSGVVAWPLAALVGVTFFSNSIEGGAPVLGLAGAAFLAALGWRSRAGAGRLAAAAYGSALVLLVAYGAWQGGFPQFTELGWV